MILWKWKKMKSIKMIIKCITKTKINHKHNKIIHRNNKMINPLLLKV
jgi:hypothetical protein